MPMRKKTLRQLTTEARKLARLVNDLESVARRLKNLIPTIVSVEMMARGEIKSKEHWNKAKNTGELAQDFIDYIEGDNGDNTKATR